VEITASTTIDGNTTTTTQTVDIPEADGKCDQKALNSFEESYTKCKPPPAAIEHVQSMVKVEPELTTGGLECTNKKLKLVSQSFSLGGNLTMSLKPGTTTTGTMSMTAKADMEYIRFYQRQVMKIPIADPMYPENPEQMMFVDTRMMLNAANKRVAFSTNMTIPGMPETTTNCSYMVLPYLRSSYYLRQCIEDAFDKEGLAPAVTPGVGIVGPFCMKNGLYDEWTIVLDIEANKTEPPQPKMKVTYNIDMNDEMLTQGLSYEVAVEGSDTFLGTLKPTAPTTAMGPTEEDLDYNTWGFSNCAQLPFVPPGEGMMQFQFQQVWQHAFQKAIKLGAKLPSEGATGILSHLMRTQGGRRLQGEKPMMPAFAKCFVPPDADVMETVVNV